MSWGKGDPQKDVITIIYLDEGGRLREHTRLDNLVDEDNRKELRDILKRRRPDVITVGGFSIATAKLLLGVEQKLGDGMSVRVGDGLSEEIRNLREFGG